MKKSQRKYVDLGKYGFVLEARYFLKGWTKSSRFLARASVAQKLVEARKLLPKGYNFKIWDAKRTWDTQQKLIRWCEQELTRAHPDWPRRRILAEVQKFCGRPQKVLRNPGTHRQGGALDIIIVNRLGKELDMGTDHDDLSEKAHPLYYERKRSLTRREQQIRANRRLLKRVTEQVGFKQHSEEWWDFNSSK